MLDDIKSNKYRHGIRRCFSFESFMLVSQLLQFSSSYYVYAINGIFPESKLPNKLFLGRLIRQFESPETLFPELILPNELFPESYFFRKFKPQKSCTLV